MNSIRKIMNARHEMPGLSIGMINEKLDSKEKNLSDDYKNRLYVRKKIVEYIKQGLSKQEIIDNILSDDIMKNFEYLKNNGLSIDKCVTNWVDVEIRRGNGSKNLYRER